MRRPTGAGYLSYVFSRDIFGRGPPDACLDFAKVYRRRSGVVSATASELSSELLLSVCRLEKGIRTWVLRHYRRKWCFWLRARLGKRRRRRDGTEVEFRAGCRESAVDIASIDPTPRARPGTHLEPREPSREAREVDEAVVAGVEDDLQGAGRTRCGL